MKYRVVKKRPQICNDVVVLSNRIQAKRNKIFKEQSLLNSMKTYEVMTLFAFALFNSEIRKRV